MTLSNTILKVASKRLIMRISTHKEGMQTRHETSSKFPSLIFAQVAARIFRLAIQKPKYKRL